MKKLLYALLLIGMILPFTSCSKDEDCEIEVEYPYIFVMEYGESGQTSFTYENAVSFSTSSVPDGWSVSVSKSDKTITATAPDESDEDAEKTGIVYVIAKDSEGDSYYVSVLLSVAEKVALDDPDNDQQANCMIVTQPNTIYSFNPNRRGESTDEVAEKAVDCEIVWRTSGYPIRFVEMTDDGDIRFYTFPDTDDGDYVLYEGNAIIAALGNDDEVLWSWHIWATADPVTDVNVAGMTFLDRNIGAMTNINTATTDYDAEENILSSYGLYYQWGRKDPFIYPRTYNASGSTDAYLYDDSGYYFSTGYEVSNALYGTMLYAQLNPNVYVTGDDDSNRDWLYGWNQNGELWGTNGEKTIYDPSPKGYRVPTSDEYRLLTLDESEELTIESYGRTLSGELFMAYGVRTYLDYSIQNYKSDGSYARWSGNYWSTNSNGTDSEALYFDSDGKIEVTTAHRATGMQIRSIKMN